MNNNNNILATIYMPDGRPAPYLLTPDEAARFLRIDAEENPVNTLRYYQEKKLLAATYIGKRRFYSLTELVDFVNRVTRLERTVQNGKENRDLSRF